MVKDRLQKITTGYVQVIEVERFFLFFFSFPEYFSRGLTLL